MTSIIILLSILCLTYILFGTFAIFFADRIIFPCPKPSYVDSEKIFKLTLENGQTISACHLKNPKAKYTILLSHGNGEDIGEMSPWTEPLKARGFSVFTYDYPGYGTSLGKPSEKHCYMSIDTAYKYLTETCDVAPQNIILYGRSLGSGPSTELAQRNKVGGIIYEGAFTSIFRVPMRIKLLPWDTFDNLSKINQIEAPVLFIHGSKDSTVPIWHGQKLFEYAKHPKSTLWVKGAGHNDIIEVAGEKYFASILAFAKKLCS